MTIDEAIEILTRISYGDTLTVKYDIDSSIKLGIEALIRVRDDRGTSYQPIWYPLPSEENEKV